LYVERMLAVLEPPQRAVVVLHYYLDLSLPDTAAALGIPVGTAKSRLHRALGQLRAALDADERAPGLARGRPA
jgi:RNA polymerase sigma factor (sigma-70 family)